jgi:hypothetical protein
MVQIHVGETLWRFESSQPHLNTGRAGWRHPRYAFANVSTDITSIFCSACDCLGLRWTAAFPKSETAAVTIYVSRKADVARLDEFIGPKR